MIFLEISPSGCTFFVFCLVILNKSINFAHVKSLNIRNNESKSKR